MAQKGDRDIRVHYSSIDRFSESRRFKTLTGAQKYAQKWVGPHPDQGGTYAVSFDGVGKVTVSGADPDRKSVV